MTKIGAGLLRRNVVKEYLQTVLVLIRSHDAAVKMPAVAILRLRLSLEVFDPLIDPMNLCEAIGKIKELIDCRPLSADFVLEGAVITFP